MAASADYYNRRPLARSTASDELENGIPFRMKPRSLHIPHSPRETQGREMCGGFDSFEIREIRRCCGSVDRRCPVVYDPPPTMPFQEC
jgi:hypothetical protein